LPAKYGGTVCNPGFGMGWREPGDSLSVRIIKVIGLAALVVYVLPSRLQGILSQQSLVALQILVTRLGVRKRGAVELIHAVQRALVVYVVLVGAQFIPMIRLIYADPLLDAVRPKLLLRAPALGFRCGVLLIWVRATLVIVVVVFGYNFFYSFRYWCGS